MNYLDLVWLVAFCIVACAMPLSGETYKLPPENIVRLIDSPPAPSLSISPDGKWMLLVERDAMPSIEDISRRMLRLAGLRIDPAARMRFQTSFRKKISIKRRGTDKTIDIATPENARLSTISWCHDSKSLAIVAITEAGTELHVVSLSNPSVTKKLTDRLSMVLEGFHWAPDGKSIVAVVQAEGQGPEPKEDMAPTGPNIQETSGNTSPTRTYQDLLQSQRDEELFDYYGTGQLVRLNLDGTTKPIGKPAMLYSADTSPDGNFLLVTTVRRPYSHIQTISSFPRDVEVWNQDGEVVYTVANVPLAENIPIQGVRTGPRMIDWQSEQPASLHWAEALDGGDPEAKVDHRDRWLEIAAPFTSEPQEVLRVEHRAYGVGFLEDNRKWITTEYDRDRRWVRTLLHDLDDQKSEPRILMDRSIRDRYGDPGNMLSRANEHGHRIMFEKDGWVYRTGGGATPEGMLPFLDRQNLATMETERLWRCEPGQYERVVDIIGGTADVPEFVTLHQSTNEVPNYFIRKGATDEKNALTKFPNLTPEVQQITKRLVKYERSDGIPLSATLYLPPNYVKGTRLPLLVWAYPVEYNDASTAGQIGTSPWLFTQIRGSSHLALLTAGYAILDGATIPIVGDPETMNDTFIEQAVDAAKAAIDKAVELGVADRNRVAVGGHSYGAFMTANLLAHSDLFQAGIARSGAYNRTLTPFGFQSERRPFWEAKEIYFNISPFMHADKLTEPLLLVHGEEDNNSGTFPIQSKRLYQAIKGNGGTARLVMLPKESHGYRARESVLHVQAEMLEWLDQHVKNASE